MNHGFRFPVSPHSLAIRCSLSTYADEPVVNEQHDYFVSYSSHDVAPARCIVERLLGEDRRVWFSEYYVRSDRQERFQQLINEAIDRSREAVLVVGARYADSPYCNVEVERLLRRKRLDRIHLCVVDPGGLERLFGLYPELANGPLRWPIEPRTNVLLGGREWVVRDAGFAIDISAWAPEPRSHSREDAWADAFALAGLQGRPEHHTFRATEGLEARLSIHYARVDGAEADLIRARYRGTDDDAETADRRRLKEELRYFQAEADRVFKAVTRPADFVPGDYGVPPPRSVGQWRGEVEEFGVHLFSVRIAGHEIKQRLFTFRLGALPAIFRMYKLSFLHPLLAEAPFVVRFMFRFPDDRRAFFRAIPWCDALVGSLRLLDNAIPTSTALVEQSLDFVRQMNGSR